MQAQRFALERAQLEAIANERVMQLENELAIAKQSLFSVQNQVQSSNTSPKANTQGLRSAVAHATAGSPQGHVVAHATAFETPPAVHTNIHSPGNAPSSSYAQPVNQTAIAPLVTHVTNESAQLQLLLQNLATSFASMQSGFTETVQAINLRLGQLEAKAIQPPPVQPAQMQSSKSSPKGKAKGVTKPVQETSDSAPPAQVPKMVRKSLPVPPFPGTVVWGANPPPPPPQQTFSDHESNDPPDSDPPFGSDDDWDEGDEEEEEEEWEEEWENDDPEIVPPPPLCSLCGGPHDDINCPSRRNPTAQTSPAGSTSSQKPRKESSVVITKGLDNFKISTLPKDAASGVMRSSQKSVGTTAPMTATSMDG